MMPTSSGSVDLSQNRQPDLYVAATVPFAFALICVALRFWCRWVTCAGFWVDDWLISLALVFATGSSALLFWWIPHALGRHVQTFGPHVQEHFAIGLFAGELIYPGVLLFVKFSIIALYWRIFSKHSGIRIPIIILSTTISAWGIAVFLLAFIQCIPLRGFWDKTIEAACNVNVQKYFYAISIPNIFVDITLLVLPIPFVVRLNVTKNQKQVVVSIFLLGGFVCIASILRLVAVITESTNEDVSWNFVNHIIWAVVEANSAIVSACLPTMRPLWLAIRSKTYPVKQPRPSVYPRSSHTTRTSHTTRFWGGSLTRTRVADEENAHPFSSANIVAGESSRTGLVPENDPQLVPDPCRTHITVIIPLQQTQSNNQSMDSGAIRVRNDWQVEYS